MRCIDCGMLVTSRVRRLHAATLHAALDCTSHAFFRLRPPCVGLVKGVTSCNKRPGAAEPTGGACRAPTLRHEKIRDEIALAAKRVGLPGVVVSLPETKIFRRFLQRRFSCTACPHPRSSP